MKETETNPGTDFIRTIIKEDVASGKNDGQVVTRFPPEPNGYLHIGHAKSICLNFGVAREFKGTCSLRFDDTNPSKEEVAYVEAIKTDVQWLGFDWEDREHFTSNYFDQLYGYALQLIETGKAYVCSLNAEETRAYRGTLTEPGKDSPYRSRSVEENLDLFQRMRAGEFEEGTHVLRARIDMASPNILMRDPTLYRIRYVTHHRTGDKWCIYPMYDFAHCLSDAIEGVTHSLCTLEFENNRPLYDWILDNVIIPCHPRQIEFARLNLTHTVLSKRKLIQLVEGNHVDGWDDPRLPTLSGLRRRGYSPAAIKTFCDRIGLAKRDSIVDMALLEHCVREDLNKTAPRVMAVLRPLKVVIENYPENQVETFDFPNHPEYPEMGARTVPFSKILYIEQDDFMEDPPKKFFRLGPGREVRLRYAYFIKCIDVVKDKDSGDVIELRCTYDPETKGGNAPDGRKVKATMHWVSAEQAATAEVRLYDALLEDSPDGDDAAGDFMDHLNPDSLTTLTNCKLEPSLLQAVPGDRFQFERLGYFCADTDRADGGTPIFNRAVTLRDQWAKIKKGKKK